jgi:hypothetical protein
MPLNALGRRYSDAPTFWFLRGAPSRPQKAASVHMTFRRVSYVHSERFERYSTNNSNSSLNLLHAYSMQNAYLTLYHPGKQFDTYMFENPNILQSF